MEKPCSENFGCSLGLAFLMVGLLLIGGCTNQANVPPQVQVLNQKIQDTESRIKEWDAKLQSASHDTGLKDNLTEQIALARSRLARLRHQRHALAPEYPRESKPEPPAEP